MSAVKPIAPKLLRRDFNPREVPFDTSDQPKKCREVVLGQARAKEALEFGLSIREQGYHIFVAGPPRTGKTHLVTSFLSRMAKEDKAPSDWAYVNNFHDPGEPKALRLAPGGARKLSREMDRLVELLKKKIPEVFEGEEYSNRKDAIASRVKERRTKIFSDLDQKARSEGYLLRFEPTGIMVAPADEDGQMLPENRIREMNEQERQELRRKSDLLQAEVTDALRQVAGLEKELEEKIKGLNREMVLFAVGPLFQDLAEAYSDQPEVKDYIEQARQDVSENFGRFQKKEAPPIPIPMAQESDSFTDYKVNVFVDNSRVGGAPVILEDHPTFPNLFGRIERQARMGTLVTDFTLLTPGSLHKANGGYLVLPVMQLLTMGLPWEALKRALMTNKAAMEDAMEQYGFMATRGLRPQPIPLDLKIILVGESRWFELLQTYDPQFPKLFKVRAQMSERMEWNELEVKDFIDHMCRLTREAGRLPLDRTALARLVELAAELSGDRERLTLRLSEIRDVLAESAHYAKQAKRKAVSAKEIEKAVDGRRYRASMMEDRMREAVTRDFINIRTGGQAVGEINGLAVLTSGDYSFGQPSRISASLGLGKEGVVAIDRESKLSGPFHTKGVLILGGFMRDKFGQDGPLTLTAGLTFEQSYSMIDGDSASLAELLVLLSRLSGAPLRQDLAVTGSVSQKGLVQAIGGVNQKVEGFFRLCQVRRLSGSQGVVIPKTNLPNLMLHKDVVAAAKKGKFAVYAVETVEQALELFTGLKAGKLNKNGSYTKGSVYQAAREELLRLRQVARELNNGDKKE